jgi:hypothetical protein
MLFENEKAFESHIRHLIKNFILNENKDLVLFDSKKAVDVLICKNGSKPQLFFVEIKYHKKKHGRLSTGHGKGGGFQPEILTRKPDYFETNMRWILGAEGHEGYYLLKNSELRRYISGGGIGEKYNNIKPKLFKTEIPSTELELIGKLKIWLTNK